MRRTLSLISPLSFRWRILALSASAISILLSATLLYVRLWRWCLTLVVSLLHVRLRRWCLALVVSLLHVRLRRRCLALAAALLSVRLRRWCLALAVSLPLRAGQIPRRFSHPVDLKCKDNLFKRFLSYLCCK